MATPMLESSRIESKRDESFLCRFLSILSPKKKPALPSRLSPIVSRAEQPEGMARIMSRLDEDGDGKISPAELRKCMLALGEDLTMEEVESAVERADSDGDGLLGLEDITRLADGEWEGDDEERRRNLREAFRVYEMEGEGCITPRSLKATLGRLGDARSVEECVAMISRFDVDGDGVLNFEEFRLMMMI